MSAKSLREMSNKAAVGRLTESGYFARQIADELGISPRSVTRIRASLGISQPLARRFSEEEHQQVLDMLEDGVSLPEIGRTIGRSSDVLWRRYKGMSQGKSLCDSIQLRRRLGLEIS